MLLAVAALSRGGGVFREMGMEDLALAMFDYKETIQDSKCEGGYGEEVHGRDGIAPVAQESSPELPCLVGRRQEPDIARDGTFGDVEAEFEELTVNSWCAPGRLQRERKKALRQVRNPRITGNTSPDLYHRGQYQRLIQLIEFADSRNFGDIQP
jgi:hypothetical protein